MKQDSEWYLNEICRTLPDNKCIIYARFSQCDGVRSSEWGTFVEREAKNILDAAHPLQVAEMLRELASTLEKNFGEVETRADDFTNIWGNGEI